MFGPFSTDDGETEPKVVNRGTEKITEKKEFKIVTVEIGLTDGSVRKKEGILYEHEPSWEEPLKVKTLENVEDFDIESLSWPCNEELIYKAAADKIVDIGITNRRTLVVEGEATVSYNKMSDGSKEYTAVDSENLERYFKEDYE